MLDYELRLVPLAGIQSNPRKRTQQNPISMFNTKCSGGDEDKDYDQLREFNKEAQRDGIKESSQWLPLESNPDILNSFVKSVGLCSDLQVVDVLYPGMYKSEDCFGFLLLFPCTEPIYKFRWEEDKRIRNIPNYKDVSNHFMLCAAGA